MRKQRFVILLFLAVTLVVQKDVKAAINPATIEAIEAIFALSRTAVSLLGGDPQGVTVAGNRPLLLGVHDKLRRIEERQRWVQQVLTELPSDFLDLLDTHEAKQLISRLRVQLLEMKRHEELFAVETTNTVKTAWRLHYDRLKRLREKLHQTLAWMKVDDNPLLFAGRAATYGLLLHVQGMIIGIDKMMLTIDPELAHTMGFRENVSAREKRTNVELAVRLELAREAHEAMGTLLRRPLTDSITNELAKLRSSQAVHGTIAGWFPHWTTTFPPSNRPIDAAIDKIARLLDGACPRTPIARSSLGFAGRWLRELVYGVPYGSGGYTAATKLAKNAEYQCGLAVGALTQLEHTPFHTTSEVSNSLLRTMRFRTPVYKFLTDFRRGKTYWIGQTERKYYVQSRQYDVTVRFRTIPRSVVKGREGWGSASTRLPGVDTFEYWAHKEGKRTEKIPTALKPEVYRNVWWYVSGRRTFQWVSTKGFEVYYLDVRDLRQTKTGHRLQRTVTRGGPQGVCFASLATGSVSEKIDRVVTTMLTTMDTSPKVHLVPRPMCGGPRIDGTPGLPWAPGRVGTDPNAAAKISNVHMSQLEFLFRIHAEVERSYVAFGTFIRGLTNGSEPELEHVVHPGAVASLIAFETNRLRPELLEELLAQDGATRDTDARIDVIMQHTHDSIEAERRKNTLRRRLMLGLMVAELTYEYAPIVAEGLGSAVPGSSEDEISVEIEEIDDAEVAAILKEVTHAPVKKATNPMKRREPPDEPGLIRSTPLLGLFGGLGTAKIGKAVFTKGGKAVARLWFLRQAKGRTTLLFETLSRHVVSRAGGKTVVSLSIKKAEFTKSLADALLRVQRALKAGQSKVALAKKLTFKEVVVLGKRFVCGGNECAAALGLPNYAGVYFKKGSRQFRIGVKTKDGKEIFEANFERLGTNEHVHYVLKRF